MESFYRIVNRNNIINILLIILLLLDLNNSQEVLFYNIQAFHFRQQTNPDFGIPLGSVGTSGVVTNNLGADGYPEYCCGDQSKYTSNGNTLLVHNASTFAEWWRGSIDQTECNNHGILLPLVLGEYTQNGGYFYTTPDYIRNTFTNQGLNDFNQYPEYENDGQVYSFCWKTELDYTFTPNGNNMGTISAIYPGEILIYIDGVLRISRMGTTSSGNQLLTITGEQNKTYHMDMFGCERASNTLWEINIRFFDIIPTCQVNQCGTCGYSVCPETCNNATSCRYLTPVCGSCLDEGTKDCELENDHSDPCVTYVCVEGSGCVAQYDPACGECNSTNCVSDDLCIMAECRNNECIKEPIDCLSQLENCDIATCLKGDCICIHILNPNITIPTLRPKLTTTTTTTTTTTATTATTATTTGQSTLSSSQSTFSQTTDQTTFSSTTDQTIFSSTTDQTLITTSTTYSPVSLSASTIHSPVSISTTEQTAISTSTIYSSLSTTSSTTSTNKQYICNESSCPIGYCCVQLFKSFSCVSSYFEKECHVERLKDFY